jgi:putative ABC transport system permease protein
MVISKESIKYSLNNIRKSKARSLLTILSIFVGIATIFIFISYGWGLYDYIDDFTSSSSIDKLIIQPKGIGAPALDTTFKLLDGDVDAVKNTPGVYDAAGMYIAVGEVVQDNLRKYVFVSGYDPRFTLINELSNIDIIEGRDLHTGDSGKVVLGYNYMLENKIFPKKYVLNNKIEVQGQDLQIIGFYESAGNPQDDSNIYVTGDFIHELYPERNLSYSIIVARVDKDDIAGTASKVEDNLRRHRDLEKGREDFSVSSFEDLLESFSSVLNIVIGFILLIAFISVIVSAVNTANTMITSVLERFKEIGVLKSIGARNSEVFKIFLFESGFLGFVAGVIGVIVGWAGSEVGSNILDNLGYGFLSPHYSWVLFAALIAFATFTGAISGLTPAWRASKINAVDALRYE